MELWTRDDGRFYAMNLERDLYGPAVVVWYGGRDVSRTMIFPVVDTVDGERVIDQLAHRRRRHGYRLVNGTDTAPPTTPSTRHDPASAPPGTPEFAILCKFANCACTRPE